MRSLFVVGFVFAIFTLWAVTLTSSPQSSHGDPIGVTVSSGSSPRRSIDEKRAMAVAFVQQQMTDNMIPGLTLAIVYKNETVLAQGFGTKQVGNTDSPVTAHTLFQIGSFTKTFVALGLAKLVDDGLVSWSDPVKTHFASFQLQDKYAEAVTTLADLLSMNSVLSAFDGDVAWALGVAPSEANLVRRVASLNTTRPVRDGYAYSNLNFEILGQVVEAVTNQTWFHFIKTTILDPLGMHDTVGRPADAPNASELSFGHLSCNGHVLGPFSLVDSTMVALSPNNNFLAAGSMLSSASDLATLIRFLLRRGAGIFHSPQPIEDMTTGHTVLSNMVVTGLNGADLFGLNFRPDGNVMAAGYGFDVVGDVLFGYDFYTKNGDTLAFKQRNGFVPSQGLGLSIVANVQSKAAPGSAAYFLLDRMRSYLLGLFLDVPQPELDAMWTQGVADAIQADEQCDLHFFGSEPWTPPGTIIPAATQALLVGTYKTIASPEYYGPLKIVQDAEHGLELQFGAYTRPLVATADPAVLVWTLEFDADTWPVVVTNLGNNQTTLTFGGLAWVR
ncbi:Aste57867_751 [Aphanomyces stellatus]|uniref:Aste57867_751 protein n=1 Tax=Aphanomyces stellatus TaxID=120398 RepID=A0A485K6N2_9STRA|nr:hypothetical protein As57867_000750 [Aphanomyces stellatus]VFT77975.1 Aste57867_751 [Aphanomyces stellatus]